jgi:hypothetical protein
MGEPLFHINDLVTVVSRRGEPLEGVGRVRRVSAMLDGGFTYRVTGRRGEIDEWRLSTYEVLTMVLPEPCDHTLELGRYGRFLTIGGVCMRCGVNVSALSVLPDEYHVLRGVVTRGDADDE